MKKGVSYERPCVRLKSGDVWQKPCGKLQTRLQAHACSLKAEMITPRTRDLTTISRREDAKIDLISRMSTSPSLRRSFPCQCVFIGLCLHFVYFVPCCVEVSCLCTMTILRLNKTVSYHDHREVNKNEGNRPQCRQFVRISPNA